MPRPAMFRAGCVLLPGLYLCRGLCLWHYDVTGKVCPAPFVGAGKAAWEEFKGGLTVYQKLENVPEWAKPTVQKVVEKGALQGDEQGNLNLSGDLTRTLVILDRLGKLD